MSICVRRYVSPSADEAMNVDMSLDLGSLSKAERHLRDDGQRWNRRIGKHRNVCFWPIAASYEKPQSTRIG